MGYLNSDDCLMPGALHYIGRYFQQHPEIDLVYGHRIIINADGLKGGQMGDSSARRAVRSTLRLSSSGNTFLEKTMLRKSWRN
jgi:hypothetical protein